MNVQYISIARFDACYSEDEVVVKEMGGRPDRYKISVGGSTRKKNNNNNTST